MKNQIRLLIAFIIFHSTFIVSADAQGTAFTYQGRLNSGSAPANGNYDVVFALYNDPLLGSQVGSAITNSVVPVTNGLFTTAIDFGGAPWTGQLLYLQILVRTNGNGALTPLNPRQQVTPAPYSILAANAGSANSVAAANVSGVLLNSSLPASPVFSGAVTASSFSGNGASVANVNAAALNGLNATNFWQLGGNSVAPGQFLGALNNQPVELWANGSRAFRLEPNPGGAPNVIGGSPVNYVVGGVTGATIAGGGQNGLTNRITGSGGFVGGGFNNAVSNFNGVVSGGANNTVAGNASGIGSGSENDVEGDHSVIASGQANLIQANADHSVIGGGGNNLVVGSSSLPVYSIIGGGQFNIIATNSNYSTIGGGFGNTNNSGYATIGGGYDNNVSGVFATLGGGQNNANYANSGTIGGGLNNQVSGIYSTIGGGNANSVSGPLGSIGGGANNQASGIYSTVPGGFQNNAGGSASFAAGSQAQATNQGAFVWADSQSSPFASTANNQFLVRAQGGVGINMNNPNGASLYVQGDRTNNWPNSMSFFENTETGTNASPALRVVSDAANTPAGALSVSVQGNGLIAQFGNGGGFVSQLDANGNWTANSFTGGGGGLTGLNAASLTGAVPSSSLTSVPAASLTGTIPLAQLPGAVVTNTEKGVILSGTFSGNGGGLTNLNVSTLQLAGSANNNVFVGPAGNSTTTGANDTAAGYQALSANTTGHENTAAGQAALQANTTGFANTAIGEGALFNNVIGVENTAIGDNALSQLVSGTNNIALGYVAGSQISGTGNIDIGNTGVSTDNNIIRIGSTQTQTYIAGVINGNGGGLTNLPAANLTGALPAISGASLTSLPANAALLGASQSFTGGNTFTSTTTITNSGGANSLNVYGTQTGGWANPVSLFENKSTAATASPALRVLCDGGTNLDGALSVSVSTGTTGLIAEFGNSTAFVVRITNNGSIFAAGNVYANGVLLTSDRNAKEHFQPVDNQAVLARVAALPVTQWNYKQDQAAVQHIGPMAQDFQAAFGLDGGDDKHISVVDESGVALAAIQGLNQKVEERSQRSEVWSQKAESQIEELKAENAELKARLNELEATVKAIAEGK